MSTRVTRKEIADYLNTGTSASPDYTLMGVGFNSLDENTGAQTESVTYINEDAASKYVTGYETSFPFDTELIADDDAVAFIYDVARDQKTGANAETDYVRVELFKPRMETAAGAAVASLVGYEARKFRVSVEVSDVKGDAGKIIKVSGNLNVIGEFTDGVFDTSAKTFTDNGSTVIVAEDETL